MKLRGWAQASSDVGKIGESVIYERKPAFIGIAANLVCAVDGYMWMELAVNGPGTN